MSNKGRYSIWFAAIFILLLWPVGFHFFGAFLLTALITGGLAIGERVMDNKSIGYDSTKRLR